MNEGAFNEKAYGSLELVLMIKAMPCVVCHDYTVESDTAHVGSSKGAGGSYKDLIPLCRVHHTELHAIGKTSFQKVHDICLEAEAERTRYVLRTLKVPPYDKC